ncbi:MAG: hypothetical protein LBN95_10840 [Prevotellaceae bacterium]|jgi:hypothetical protein|nr:hypothetical protein [Prevotellaceae bacterium]
MNKEIHTGNLIKQKLSEKDRSISWLAKKVNKNSGNFSRMLTKKDINTDLLISISVALEYNFFEVISQYINERLSTVKLLM